jgi:hypothetical protein
MSFCSSSNNPSNPAYFPIRPCCRHALRLVVRRKLITVLFDLFTLYGDEGYDKGSPSCTDMYISPRLGPDLPVYRLV